MIECKARFAWVVIVFLFTFPKFISEIKMQHKSSPKGHLQVCSEGDSLVWS